MPVAEAGRSGCDGWIDPRHASAGFVRQGAERLALPKARACRMVALVLLTVDEHDREQAILLTPTRNTNQGKVGEGITRCALF